MALVAWLLTATYYFYQYMLRSAPAVMMPELSEAFGLNADLVIAGDQRYILVAVWEPAGSTANGWVTFYETDDSNGANIVLGRDPRRPELFIFQRVGEASE